MSKSIKQLKIDRTYLLMTIKLFDGETKPLELMICEQYKTMLKELEEQIRKLENEDKHNS